MSDQAPVDLTRLIAYLDARVAGGQVAKLSPASARLTAEVLRIRHMAPARLERHYNLSVADGADGRPETLLETSRLDIAKLAYDWLIEQRPGACVMIKNGIRVVKQSTQCREGG